MRSRRRLGPPLLAALALIGIASAAPAQPPLRVHRCYQDLPDVPVPLPAPIPGGCEAVDCCPGCDHGPIDWKVEVEGLDALSLTLVFEDLPAQAAERLTVPSYATASGEPAIELREGETRLADVARSGDESVPVAMPHVALDPAALVALRRAAEAEGRARLDTLRVKLEIDQLRGPVVVYSHSIELVVGDCLVDPGPLFDTDFIRLLDNRGGDEAGLWLDARLKPVGCENDLQVCAVEQKILPNLRAGCSKEVIAFSRDDAMVWRRAAWTDETGDVFGIRFPELLAVPLRIWILDAPFAGSKQDAELDVDRANQLFNEQHCGIRFVPSFVDVTADPDAIQLEGADSPASCSKLKSKIGFDEGAINAYYLGHDATSRQCPEDSKFGESGDPAVKIFRPSKSRETLAHEIGHVFSLAHPDCYPDFEGTLTGDNLMVPGLSSGLRRVITEAQCFRMNADEISWMNLLGIREGATRSCWADLGCEAQINKACPRIANDIPHPEVPGLVFSMCGAESELALP